MSSQQNDIDFGELSPTAELAVINERLKKFRQMGVHLIGPGVKSLVKLESLPAGYKVVWHAFRVDPVQDVYREKSWDTDVYALKRSILLEFWNSADGKYEHSLREDDGRQQFFTRYTWAGSVLSLSGMKVPAAATKETDLMDGSAEISPTMTEAQLRKSRSNINQVTESKAQNRVIRQLLGIAPQYTAKELQVPFILMKLVFVPDMSDPMTRFLVVSNAIGASASLFGGPGGAEILKQLMSSKVERDGDELALTTGHPQRSIAAGDAPKDPPKDEPKPKEETLPFTKPADEPPFTVQLQQINSISDYEKLEAVCVQGMASEALVLALEDLKNRNPNKKAVPISKPFTEWIPAHRRMYVEAMLGK